MRKIYSITHECIIDTKEKYKERLLIGLFTNKKSVNLVIKKYARKKGFCDYPMNSFKIKKYYLSGVEKTHGVYFLQYEYDVGEDNLYTVSDGLGVYRSAAEAKAAMYIYMKKSPFNQFPVDCFHVGYYKIGQCHWTEGFVLV